MKEKPSATVEKYFNDSLDIATHAVIAEFEWLGLPEGDQLSGLIADINDAITAAMADWK